MDVDYYGLTEPAFALTPDTRFYFPSAGHRRAMAYLGYGLAQGEGFVVVTGEIGAGKSTLVGHLMATVDPLRVTVAALGSTQVDATDMLRLACTAFGVETADPAKAALLAGMQAFLHSQARAGKKTLLVVDEAQALSCAALEELRLLSNFIEGGRALLQIFLLGQPEFRDRLEGDPALEQLRQRVIASHHLDAMPLAEVTPYLTHRLTCAGWTGRPAIEPGAAAALHAASGGIPRRLNTLATRLLLHGALARRDLLDASDVAAIVDDLGVQGRPAMPSIEEREFTDAQGLSLEASEAERMWVRRVELIEARLEEQDAAIRRMLTLMVDWVERAPASIARPDARAA